MIVRVTPDPSGYWVAVMRCDIYVTKINNLRAGTYDSPSHAELLANGAERLKQELMAVADSCMREFKNKIYPRNQQMLSEA